MTTQAGHDPQEIEWIRQAQQGSHEAFGFLVERFQRRVFGLVYRLVGQRDEVEDLAQETFVKAYRAIGSYTFASPFGNWLSRVAVNHCYDFLRRERTKPERWEPLGLDGESATPWVELAPSHEISPEKQAMLRDLVRKLLARAPADDRVVLVLKEMEGQSVEEIAELLGLKTATVKVRLHRARKRMLEDFRRLQKGE